MEQPDPDVVLSPTVQAVVDGFATPELPDGPTIEYRGENGVKTGTVREAVMHCQKLRDMGEIDPADLIETLNIYVSNG